MRLFIILTLSLPLTRICVNISTVYNDTLVAKGLMIKFKMMTVAILTVVTSGVGCRVGNPGGTDV